MTEHGPVPIAIVGLGAVMPDAPDVGAFWTNLREGRYSIRDDVPPERWDVDLYYDPDPHAPDKTYSRIGGWVREFPWEPLAWKLPIPPKVAEQMDDGQKWAIACTRAALVDAGWPEWKVDQEKVAVIFGNAIGGEKHYGTNMRIEFPQFTRSLRESPSFTMLPDAAQQAIVEEVHKAFVSHYAEINEDTMPGELANVIAGRISNLFNFRGPNFTTDAACASALAAVTAAADGLANGQYDAAVTGGIDRNMGVAAFVKFCKIGALSATGTRPFDAGADGFVMGEGAAVFVLKRLADAERDGDKVYAVLLGSAGSSDGKGKGITAPNPAGQKLAISRAWENAGVSPVSATYVEAHGTSTRVGDAAELDTLNTVFGGAGAAPGSILLGSVKSNIGHLKAGAGAAGLLKSVLQLNDKVIAPSLHFVDPNPIVDWPSSAFRVNTELREWPVGSDGVRRGGVSAFGFGGTNFHAVVEEYVPGRYPQGGAKSFAGAEVPQVTSSTTSAERKPPLRGAAVVGGSSDADVVAQLTTLGEQAKAGNAPAPAAPDSSVRDAAVRVAIDFADAAELSAKVDKTLKAFAANQPAMWKMLRSQGVFVGRGPAPKVAFLYTGQGSQYVNMLEQLRDIEPIVAQTFADADRVMTPLLGRPLTSFIFDGHDPESVARMEEQLKQTEITQPAVLATDLSMTRLLAAYGVEPDMVMGHSLGEYGALVAAGALSFDAALEAVSARGREMAHLSVGDNGAMAAVFAPLPEIERIVAAADGYVVLANVNSNSQAVVGGATAAVLQIIEQFQTAGYTAVQIPVSHAFHTSIVAPASVPLMDALRRLDVRAPRLPIVANVTGDFYPQDATVEQMLDILGKQVASPVQFVKGLQTLYAAGARVFVEVGPKKALHGFVEDVLSSEHDDVLALFTNHPKLGDVASVNQALCGLWAAGLGYPAPAAAPAPAPAPAPAAVAATPAPVIAVTTPPRKVMPEDRYAAMGHLLAEFLDKGRELFTATAPEAQAAYAVSSEPVVVTGAGLGLPGVEHVFDDGNVARILAGEQFISLIPAPVRQEMADMHIVRLVKGEDGSGSFVTIDSPADVIKLAARHSPLDGVTELGIEPERDPALDEVTRMAAGAGFDALRDAGIPLVMRYKTTSIGTQLPERWGLPESMRDDTGIVFAAAFPAYDSFATDLRRYHEDKARRRMLAALEAVRARLTGTEPVTADVDRRIAEVRAEIDADPFVFDRRFLFRALSMGHSQFAEMIGARGPNTQVNSACASTTLAVSVAEDWIRTGRCRRVIVISADDATSDELMPWIGSGFLASGAAATDERVEDAALPFDRRRHGMLIGTGAAALVVESASAAAERGIAPIAEVLSTVSANSAFHGTRLDVEHIKGVMEQLMRQAEARGVDRRQIAAQTVFISHETYTPARGGSAAAEINALRHVFGPDADSVVISNTKGFTGHAMGAGVEDVVAVKAIETGLVPAVANFREVDPELGNLNLSRGGAYDVSYALRLAAGFGSQISMSLMRWVPTRDGRRRTPAELGFRYRVVDDAAWRRFLSDAVGRDDAELEVVTRRLRVKETGLPAAKPAAAPAAVAVEVPAPRPAPIVIPEPVAVAAAPAPAAASAAPAAPPAPAAAGDPVRDTVMAVVAETTGYPVELLDPDLDLEADLGIDTVKQAEVFAAVREKFDIERDENLKLRDFPTLNHVIDWMRERAQVAAAPPAGVEQPVESPLVAPVAAPSVLGDLAATDRLPRRVPVPVRRPALANCKPTDVTLDGARVVVAPDTGGVGDALVKRLRKAGATPLPLDAHATREEIEAQLTAWLEEGPISGVFWLPALDDEGPLDALDLAGWREGNRIRVKNLYATIRHLVDARPFLVSATRLGGYHGYDDDGAVAPLGGAVTGFTKAYKREQPEATVKAVDFPASRKTAWVADALMEETLTDPGCVEVGRVDGNRWAVGLAERPFGDGTGGIELTKDAVFLVTGAAGSIVCAITADLAEASGGTFHLLDLTPEPDPDDPDLRRFATDREGLKADIANRLKAAGERPTPVLIEKELAKYERLLAALTAIESVRAAGGTVHYHSVDLTDAEKVAAVVDAVRETSGRVDVLLHAAGIEISRSLADKQPREYDLVFDVKSDGWFNLVHAAQGLPIGATVGFTSVAGRFGNAGQTDYSAANDLLCKIASSMRRTHPETRAITLDWTAWGGIGMATRGSIPKIMEMAGIDMLPPEAGVAWIRRELTAGASRGEVVVAGRLGIMTSEFDETGGLAVETIDVTHTGPMVGRVTGAGIYSGLTVETTLDPSQQPFLDHHRRDGVAVLPGVMGIEAFAEVARLLVPELSIAAVEDVEFLAPLKFYRDEPRTLFLSAVLQRDGDDLVADCRLEAERTLAGRSEPERTAHFTAHVRLGHHGPTAERVDVPLKQASVTAAPESVYTVYFHGPAYQVVKSAWRYNGGAEAQFADDLPPDHEPAERPLEVAPRLVELCFQTAGLWEVGREGRFALPTHVDRVTVHRDPATADTPLYAVAHPSEHGFDCSVVDAHGEVVVKVDGYRTIALPDTVPDEMRAPIAAAMHD